MFVMTWQNVSRKLPHSWKIMTLMFRRLPGLLGNNFSFVKPHKKSLWAMLWSIITKTKPKNKIQETKNCIYSIPCEFGKKCIRETGRPFNTRISENKHKKKMWENSRRLIGRGQQNTMNKAEIIHKEENRIIMKLKSQYSSSQQNKPSVNQALTYVTSIWCPLLNNTKLDVLT
jgi:hypothetical protein